MEQRRAPRQQRRLLGGRDGAGGCRRARRVAPAAQRVRGCLTETATGAAVAEDACRDWSRRAKRWRSIGGSGRGERCPRMLARRRARWIARVSGPAHSAEDVQLLEELVVLRRIQHGHDRLQGAARAAARSRGGGREP